MVCNPTVDEKISFWLNWLKKQAKISKYNRNIKYMHPWLQTLKKYNITTNGTVPASESFSLRNPGKWSGVVVMGQRTSDKYGGFENDIQLQLGPTVTLWLGLLLRFPWAEQK